MIQPDSETTLPSYSNSNFAYIMSTGRQNSKLFTMNQLQS